MALADDEKSSLCGKRHPPLRCGGGNTWSNRSRLRIEIDASGFADHLPAAIHFGRRRRLRFVVRAFLGNFLPSFDLDVFGSFDFEVFAFESNFFFCLDEDIARIGFERYLFLIGFDRKPLILLAIVHADALAAACIVDEEFGILGRSERNAFRTLFIDESQRRACA